MKTIILLSVLLFCTQSFASPTVNLVDIPLKEEIATCFQGAASALEQALTLINNDARRICHDELGGSLQFASADNIDIDLTQARNVCGTVKVSVIHSCAMIK